MNYIALRRLLSGFVLYSLGDFLLFGLSYLVILPILTRSLEPDEYGVVATLTNLTLFVAWTIQFGLPSAALRYYFNFSEAETRHSYLVGIWLLCLLLGIVVGLLVLAFGQPIWNYTIRNVPFFPYAPLIVLIAFFSVTNTFRSVLLRASDKPRLFIFVDTAQFICQAVFIYYAVTIVRLGVIGQVLGILGATGIFAGISAIIILYRVNFRQISFRLGNIFSFAWPLYLTYVIGFFQSRASVLILQFFITGGAIGIFAVGQQFGNLLLIGTSAFTKAWQPYLYSQSTEQARKTLYRIGFSVPLIMICVVGLGLLSQDLISLLTSTAYDSAWRITIPVILGSGMIAISGLINSGIYYAKRTAYEPIVTSISSAFNILACLLLIPTMQAMGAALASMCTGILTLLLTTWFAQRAFPVQQDYLRMLASITSGAAILACWIILHPSIASLSSMALLSLKGLLLSSYTVFLWWIWFSREQNKHVLQFIRVSVLHYLCTLTERE